MTSLHHSAPVDREGGGWGGGGGGYRDREEDPFAADEARKAEVDQIFAGDNTGIDFDAYEDIPVEVIAVCQQCATSGLLSRLALAVICLHNQAHSCYILKSTGNR